MSKRILVVDDDRFMAKTFSDILTMRGWETEQAWSGREAVERVRDKHFPVVLMDIRMGEMSGVDALKEIKAIAPQTRVILMTAYTAQELIDEAKSAGAMRVLSKPVDVSQLFTLLDDEQRGRTGPLLLVDDDPAFLRSLADVLRTRGYQVLEAAGIDDAVEQLKSSDVTVVLLDLRLSHIDPLDSIAAVKRTDPAVLLILYSGQPRLVDEVKASMPTEWIQGVLYKPFPPEQLIGVLDALV